MRISLTSGICTPNTDAELKVIAKTSQIAVSESSTEVLQVDQINS